MYTKNTSLFHRTYDYMRWLACRHKIVAQNLSHVDTPDYHAQDLLPFQAAHKSQHMIPLRTHARHLNPFVSSGDFALRKDSAPDVRISNNAVSIEQELIKSSEIAHAHALMTNQYKKTMNLFHLALGRRGGN